MRHLPDAEKPRRTLDAATEGGGLAVVEPETLIAPCVVAFPIAPSARHRRLFSGAVRRFRAVISGGRDDRRERATARPELRPLCRHQAVRSSGGPTFTLALQTNHSSLTVTCDHVANLPSVVTQAAQRKVHPMTPQDLQQPRTEPDAPDTEAPAEDGEQAGRGGRSIGRSLDTIKELTGLTSQQIREGFRAHPPKTLAEQAAAEGVSQDKLVAAIVAVTQHRLIEAVAAGKLTQERANERLGDLDTNVTELVSGFPTVLGGHPHARLGWRFGRGGSQENRSGNLDEPSEDSAIVT